MSVQKPKVIVSIDGGGIRGIIPALVLAEIEREIAQKTGDHTTYISHYVDLFAGTSTGGIIALGLALNDGSKKGKPRYQARELASFYFDRGEDIFDISFSKKLTSLAGVIDEKYDAADLEEALEDCLGTEYLSSGTLSHAHCLITSYDIRRRRMHLFDNINAEKPANDFRACDVARATAAAPTYFEPARIKSKTNVPYPLVDGGVFANNPSMLAYAFAREQYKIGAKDMYMISIGTGHSEQGLPYKEAKDWGQLRWAKPVIDIMMDGVAEATDFQLKQIYETVQLPKQYKRIQINIGSDASSEMDDATPENMNNLRGLAEKLIAQSDIKQIALDLVRFASS
ncbi:patatin-like phospholipase family protein [Aliiglaciecola sp. M165]|uniref:patatin-like phospholipase family protein n=1 Tax=Aliiglaciecola sp. M165 TaxID=2593649 RepID=UPI0011816343|nr:patatin-like phospholipase family protein [Aliiglaciecola sp. M165]TRY29807.1 patatin [Aliiglaciecola sp. M165]